MRGLEPLEAAVIEKLLSGEHPALQGLRRQLSHLSVASRRYSGTGFFTEFALEPEAVAVSLPNRIRFGDVEATIRGVAHGAGFVLYIDDGRLYLLEGYTYDEPWPTQVDEFALRYSDPERKGLSKVFG